MSIIPQIPPMRRTKLQEDPWQIASLFADWELTHTDLWSVTIRRESVDVKLTGRIADCWMAQHFAESETK